MPLDLHYRYFGTEGQTPLVVLHGLLGSSRNWQSAARALAEGFDVYALDLRNHGDSPHDEAMNLTAMVADVEHWISARFSVPVWLVGHSLGGKVAMRYAAAFPERVRALVVVDIAPRSYPPQYRPFLETMAQLPVDTYNSRAEAEAALEKAGVKPWATRKFLLTNLVRDQQSECFRWQCNVEALRANIDNLSAAALSPGERYTGPTLVVRGESSNFVTDYDAELLAHHFPNYELVTIPQAGHNVHTDRRDRFLQALANFRQRSRASSDAEG